MSDHYDRYNGMDKLGTDLAQLGTNLAEVGTDVPDINVGELISRKGAVSAVWNALNKEDACKELRALPSITPIQELMEVSANRDYWKAQCHAYEAEVKRIQPKRGKWHYSDGKPARIGLSFGVICDQCGTESEYCTNFCGECGADMRGEQDDSV